MGNFEVSLTEIFLNQNNPYYDFNAVYHHDDIVDIKLAYVEEIIDEGKEQRQQKSKTQQDCSGSLLTNFVWRLP